MQALQIRMPASIRDALHRIHKRLQDERPETQVSLSAAVCWAIHTAAASGAKKEGAR